MSSEQRVASIATATTNDHGGERGRAQQCERWMVTARE
jgi:hypothetical protein